MSGPGPVCQSDLARIANARFDQLEAERREQRRRDNTGTIDPNLMPLLQGAARVGELASEAMHYEEGYVAGHRAGVLHGALLGIFLGGCLVAAAFRLGFGGLL